MIKSPYLFFTNWFFIFTFQVRTYSNFLRAKSNKFVSNRSKTASLKISVSFIQFQCWFSKISPTRMWSTKQSAVWPLSTSMFPYLFSPRQISWKLFAPTHISQTRSTAQRFCSFSVNLPPVRILPSWVTKFHNCSTLWWILCRLFCPLICNSTRHILKWTRMKRNSLTVLAISLKGQFTVVTRGILKLKCHLL